jgi:hypothetical protein
MKRLVGPVALVGLAALTLSLPASGEEGGSLQRAIGKCSEIRLMVDRLRCYDRLARDVNAFEEVVAKACNCGKQEDLPNETLAAAAQAAGGAGNPYAPSAAAQAGTPRGVQRTAAQGPRTAAPGRREDGALREAYGTGKWKQIPRYKDSGEMIAIRLDLTAEREITGQSQKAARPVFTINCSDKGTEVWMETSFTSKGDDTPVTMQYDDDDPFIMRWANTSDGKYMGIWANGEDLIKRLLNVDRLTIGFVPDGASPTSTHYDLRGLALAVKPLREICIW